MTKADVIIAGAGPVGLALAMGLTQLTNGTLSIVLVDRGPQPRGATLPSIRAVALATRSIRFLDTIGIWTDLRAKAQPVSGIDITDSDLNDAVRSPAASFEMADTPDGEWAMAMVRDGDLLEHLQREVGLTASIQCLYDADVVAVESRAPQAGARAQVTLADGRTVLAALVVGADGRQSRVRQLAGIKTVRADTTQIGIVTLIRHEHPHHGRATQHFLPGGPFAVLPLAGNVSCITWSEKQENATRILAQDNVTFCAEIAQRVAGKLGAIELLGRRGHWQLERHAARDLVKHRIALVGDAARSVHPIAGQGLNIGLADAASLADVIADTAHLGLDLGLETGLQRYAQWRRPEAMRALATFEVLNDLFSSGSRIGRLVRGLAVGVVDGRTDLKAAIMLEAQGLVGDLPRLMARPVRNPSPQPCNQTISSNDAPVEVAL